MSLLFHIPFVSTDLLLALANQLEVFDKETLLSPYLFVLCAQGLSSLISKSVERRLFYGVKIAHSSPVISHLFFADDNLVFVRARKEESTHVRNCLNIYEKTSGQLVNYDKSALTFSPSTSVSTINEINNVFSVEVVKGHDLYLGLPTFSMRNKRLQFAYLRERICTRLKGWSNRFFSMGGREVLIKAVLQAIPSYAMSCFKIPDSVCYGIEQACAKFWWHDSQDKRGLHWVSWKHMCTPKSNGWLGFRNLTTSTKPFWLNKFFELYNIQIL